MKGLKGLYLLIAFFLFFDLSSFAQKAKYQSDIIFRLSRYVTWPEKNEGSKFVIGVVGSVKDFETFQKLAMEKRRSNSNPIEVRYFELTDSIDECHLLYVSEECKIQIEKIIEKTKKEPILIVSGEKGYGKSGSVINFVEIEGKLKFELNQDQANKRGLQVSDKLKMLAILI
ncbi:MAG: YfiR family protein [Cyclobacteriaceae bacterium]|nr:YfiR family protein [Cyclobacteriaceae bacterium]